MGENVMLGRGRGRRGDGESKWDGDGEHTQGHHWGHCVGH